MVKICSLSLIFVLLLLLSSSNSLKSEIKEDTTEVQTKIEKDNSFHSYASSCFSVFISGFGDKTFFISTIASITYNKWISALASLFGLIIMGVFSLVLGIEISEFIPLYLINIISSLLFIFMGLAMIYEAVTSENEEELKYLNKLEEEKIPLNQHSTTIDAKVEEATIFETFGSSDDEALKLQSKNKLEEKFENETKLYIKGKLFKL
jgi:hypothetical protein